MKPRYQLQKREDLEAALSELKGFWKLWSACLLKDFGLPTLQGLLLTRQNSESYDDSEHFLDDLGSVTSLVRHDKFPEAPPYPRGGFLVGREMLGETLEYFFSLARIVALYEPADPLLNGHNINLLFENDREIRVEVVGPGFDMSDIKRGDLSPHESFLIRLSAKGDVSEMRLLHRIGGDAYTESLTERKVKIKEKLYSSPEPMLAKKIQADLGVPEDLEEHLKDIGSPLYNSHDYLPISDEALRVTVRNIVDSGVIKEFAALTGARFPFAFSTSFVNRGQRQVFWDIVSPTLKFQGLK